MEKKRAELQRALAKEMKDIQEGKDKKRPRSSSSSSTSSSSSDSSSSDSSSSSSSDSSTVKKKSKKKKRDSSSDSDDKKSKKKKNKAVKKVPKDGEPKAKKMKTGKDDKKSQKSKDSSPKKSDPSKSDTPKINLIRPGGQARDKFGFFVAAQRLLLSVATTLASTCNLFVLSILIGFFLYDIGSTNICLASFISLVNHNQIWKVCGQHFFCQKLTSACI